MSLALDISAKHSCWDKNPLGKENVDGPRRKLGVWPEVNLTLILEIAIAFDNIIWTASIARPYPL
jgi:hypothetical protein